MREAGSNTILTSLRYLRKRASNQGTVASGRFGDKPVVCAPAGESDDEAYEIPEPSEEQNLTESSALLARGAASAVGDQSVNVVPHTRDAPGQSAEHIPAPAEKRARRGSIGFLLN